MAEETPLRYLKNLNTGLVWEQPDEAQMENLLRSHGAKGEALYIEVADLDGTPMEDAEAPPEPATVEEEPASEEADTQEDALEDLTVEELRELAATHDIEGRSSMNKAELVKALTKAEAE